MDPDRVEAIAKAIYMANGQGLTYATWEGTLECIREFVRMQARCAIRADQQWLFAQARAVLDRAKTAA